MDKLTEYPKIIQQILNEYVELCVKRSYRVSESPS